MMVAADCYPGNPEISGVADLLDFFVVHLDLNLLLQVLPPQSYEYRITQADSAVNFVYTALTTTNAGTYLRDVATARVLATSETNSVQPVGQNYAVLNTAWLQQIALNPDRGILLMEAARTSAKPLKIEVWSGGAKVCELSFPLSFSGVGQMYRWINLRGVTGQAEVDRTQTGEPPNYPDQEANPKMFVFVHGYSVNESQSRGWASEMFKRMYQSGSKARFTAVSWHGDYSQTNVPVLGDVAPNYWQNVVNAFETSPPPDCRLGQTGREHRCHRGTQPG